jgi:hypothetical protein
MKNICKNCESFRIGKIPSYRFNGGFTVGSCAGPAEADFDVGDMKSNQMAVNCGHDGGIIIGENFGCIHFIDRKGINGGLICTPTGK